METIFPYLTPTTIKSVAQDIHDSNNWGSLPQSAKDIIQECYEQYLNLTGEELILETNCPS